VGSYITMEACFHWMGTIDFYTHYKPAAEWSSGMSKSERKIFLLIFSMLGAVTAIHQIDSYLSYCIRTF
jgi:hypothetical protein